MGMTCWIMNRPLKRWRVWGKMRKIIWWRVIWHRLVNMSMILGYSVTNTHSTLSILSMMAFYACYHRFNDLMAHWCPWRTPFTIIFTKWKHDNANPLCLQGSYLSNCKRSSLVLLLTLIDLIGKHQSAPLGGKGWQWGPLATRVSHNTLIQQTQMSSRDSYTSY